MKDPILDELHRQRREQAERFQNNLAAWLHDLRERAQTSREPRRTVPLKPRQHTAPVATAEQK
jgi:hypothetical protein